MRVVIVIVLAALVAVGGVYAWKSQKAQQKAQREAARPRTLYVMVPMGIFPAFNQIKKQFLRTHPSVEFKTTIDTPEEMAHMVEENPRKPDVFISPGGHELEVLREKGFIDPQSEVAFGSYELAIIVPRGNPGKIKKVEDLLNPEVKTIALSKPDLNAACYAARMSMQNLGLWDKIQKKVKVTKCCSTSFMEVVTGRAEANIQFLGCPMDTSGKRTETDKAEVACTFPRDTYYIPRNAAGLVKGGQEPELAREFIAFLTSPQAIELMLKTKLRNDQNLPATAGPWGPAQEANPKVKKAA